MSSVVRSDVLGQIKETQQEDDISVEDGAFETRALVPLLALVVIK